MWLGHWAVTPSLAGDTEGLCVCETGRVCAIVYVRDPRSLGALCVACSVTRASCEYKVEEQNPK